MFSLNGVKFTCGEGKHLHLIAVATKCRIRFCFIFNIFISVIIPVFVDQRHCSKY